MALRVLEIWFNHDSTSATNDAINLRRGPGDGNIITAPEYVEGLKAKPVAYAFRELSGPVTIKARFGGGPANGSREIRALFNFGAENALGNVLRLPINDPGAVGLFGPVQFDATGVSDLVEFTVLGDPSQSVVSVVDMFWTWEFRRGGEWRPFDTTHHQIYLIPALPKAPWTQNPADEMAVVPLHLPWVRALDWVCTWAAGATNVAEATRRITAAINGRPNQTYDPAARDHYEIGGLVNLSRYLDELDSGAELTIECHGTSHLLTSLANVIGAYLAPIAFGNDPNPTPTEMQTKDVRLLRSTQWASEDWGHHELTVLTETLVDSTGGVLPGWAGGVIPGVFLATSSLVCDALLHVNEPNDELPVRMSFGATGTAGTYRDHLIHTGDGQLTEMYAPLQLT